MVSRTIFLSLFLPTINDSITLDVSIVHTGYIQDDSPSTITPSFFINEFIHILELFWTT